MACNDDCKECSIRWIPVPKIDYIVPAFPEENAQYWVFTFKNSPDNNKKICISGKFPYARFMSFTLYDFETGEPARFSDKTQEIEDAMIEPMPGSANPFVIGADRDTPERDYEVYLVQESSSHVGEANTLVIPSEIENPSLFIRVYVPDNPESPSGDVGLPKIRAFDEKTGEQVYCPPISTAIPKSIVNLPKPPDEDSIPLDVIHSYRPGEFGLFPNGDHPYLIVPLTLEAKRQDLVAVLRFKAPAFPRTRGEEGVTFTEDQQVRYWSVNLGEMITTGSSISVSDEDMKIGDDGMVRIVVGPKSLNAPENGNWNVFSWGWHIKPILLFRQIAPRDDYEKSFSNVDVAFNAGDYDNLSADEVLAKKATNYIQEYAPDGVYCTIEAFEDCGCGL